MRRLILLLLLVGIVLVALVRDRLYLRDPLGSVARNGVQQDDAHVYINYENDVLVREKHGTQMFVVQHWNRREAMPSGLTCVEGLLCVAPADRVIDAGDLPPGRGEAEMTNRQVSLVDGAGDKVLVTIR